MTITRTEPTEAERAALAPTRGLSPVRRDYTVTGVEIRAQADDSTIVDFYGHASVTDKGYDMYGGPDKGGWTEFVDGGAFKKTLSENPDVAFLVNHTGLTLARTKAGTLTLAEDTVGLETKAQLDTRVSIVNDITVLMEAGNLDEMSFAFRVIRQKWLDADGEEVPWWDLAGIERHITEISMHKGDVSLVNYGANPHTDAGLRSLEDAVRALAPNSDPAVVLRSIEHLQGLLPAAEAEKLGQLGDTAEADAARIAAYHADLRALHDRRAIPAA